MSQSKPSKDVLEKWCCCRDSGNPWYIFNLVNRHSNDFSNCFSPSLGTNTWSYIAFNFVFLLFFNLEQLYSFLLFFATVNFWSIGQLFYKKSPVWIYLMLVQEEDQITHYLQEYLADVICPPQCIISKTYDLVLSQYFLC